MGHFATHTTIKAPTAAVWQTLADIGSIYLWNPGVQASYLTSARPSSLGATRFCDLGGKNYLAEEVVAWQENKQLTMRITATNLPFATADIQFILQPEDESTVVTVSPIYQLKFGLLGRILDKLYVQKSYLAGMEALLAGLKTYVEAQAVASQESVTVTN